MRQTGRASELAAEARDVIGPRAWRAVQNRLCREKAETIGTQILRHTVNRYAWVPDELVRQPQRLDQDVAKGRQRAFDILERTRKMAGTDGQEFWRIPSRARRSIGPARA